jgi:FAD/FMN-containing dehydrogenase
LFRLAIGGYGLFGVVTDVTFRLVEDRVVRKSAIVRMPMNDLIADYLERVRRQPALPLCYGFLDPLCREGYYLAYEYDDAARDMPLDQLERDEISHLAFNCFAGVQRLSSWVRKKSFGLMWATSAKPETTLRSRRLLLWDQPPRAFQDMLLQKYFVPCQNFARFAQRAGEILGSYQSDLPLMTNHFRYVPGNADACLSFAPQDAICLIPCYLAKKDSPRWRARLAECTARLLDAAIELGGSYYLTFDILATPEQFHRAYPAALRFFELKRHYDPAGMFSSCFHEKYGTDPNGGTAA